MRKKLPLVLALVAIALAVALPLMAWIRQAPDPKVGTSFAAARPTLQQRFDKFDVNGNYDTGFVYCSSEPDLFGNRPKLVPMTFEGFGSELDIGRFKDIAHLVGVHPRFGQWIVIKDGIVYDPGEWSECLVCNYPCRDWVVTLVVQPVQPEEFARIACAKL